MIDVVCTVCRQDDTRLAHVVDRWRVVRCRRCGHRYVSPRPSMDDIQRLYDEDYFQNPAFQTTDHDAYFGYMDYLRDRDHIQARLSQVLGRIEAHRPPGRLLDLGCGLGFFVEVAALAGWDAHGVELNKHAVDWVNQHVSDKVRHGTVDTLEYPDASFDCVTMFDVIEHLDDPRLELGEVWRILRPGGMFVVATPDSGALFSRVLGARWLELRRAPEHLHFFDRATLSGLMRTCGFAPFDHHSMGKITTLRVVFADLKFYAPRVFGAIERVLEARGWLDRVVDLNPRTKMCVYARKDGNPAPVDALPQDLVRSKLRRALR